MPQAGVYIEGVEYTRSGATYTFDSSVVGATVEIEYQVTDATATATTALAQLDLELASGAFGQPVWGYLSTNFSSQALGYSGIAYVYAADYALNSDAGVDNLNFEVSTGSEFSASIPDANMAVVVQQFLTDGLRGVQWPAANLAALTDYSNYCISHGLFMSPALSEQSAAAEILKRWLKLTNSDVVMSGATLKVVPLGDEAKTANGATYTPVTTPVYDLGPLDFINEGRPRVRVIPRANEDVYNVIRIEYLNRANAYNVDIAEARDRAHIDQFGERVMAVIKAHEITTASLAGFVAQMELQRQIAIVNDYEFSLPWTKGRLEPLDLVTLTTSDDLDLQRVPVRITQIQESDRGQFDCTAEDAPIGVASAPLFGVQAGSGFQHDYNADPGNVDAPAIFEGPADLAGLTGIEVYAAVRGSGSAWGGCQVWVSLSGGSDYKLLATLAGGARYGTLSANALAGASSIAVQGLGAGQLGSGSTADAQGLNTLCYVGGSHPEYIAYETATLTGAGAYTLSALVHGAYGTSALSHSTGDMFVRVDQAMARSGQLDPSYVGKTIYFKFLSFNPWGGGLQSLADVSPYSYTVTGAMAQVSVVMGSRIYRQSTDPAASVFVPGNSIWYDTANGNKAYLRQAGAWVSLQDGAIATAQTAANNAQTTANTAATNASSALTQLSDIASDNVLTPGEKPVAMQDYAVITAEQSGIDAQCTNYAVTTEKTAYDTAVSALTTYLGTLTSPVAWNSLAGNTNITGTTFRSKFQDVYTTRQAALDKVSANAKARLGALALLSSVDSAQITANAATEIIYDVYDFAGAGTGSGPTTQRSFSWTPPVDCTIEWSSKIVATNVLPDAGNALGWQVTPSGGSAVSLGACQASSGAKGEFTSLTAYSATGGVALTFELRSNRSSGNPNILLYQSYMRATAVKR